MLELAETVIRVTGSSSEIVFEALPTDDPQVPQARHHTRPRGARLGARDRPRGRAAALAQGARPHTGRCVGASVCSRRPSAAAALLAVPAASASRGLLVGILDDANTLNFPTADLRHVRRAARAGRTAEPLLARGRADAPRPRRRPDRSRLQMGRLRRRRLGREGERGQGAALDRRHARLGERRRPGDEGPDERHRPARVRLRGRPPLQRHLRRPRRDAAARRCASGSPGTSRTTRSTSRPSTSAPRAAG